jgi:hypothetical protein
MHEGIALFGRHESAPSEHCGAFAAALRLIPGNPHGRGDRRVAAACGLASSRADALCTTFVLLVSEGDAPPPDLVIRGRDPRIARTRSFAAIPGSSPRMTNRNAQPSRCRCLLP